MKKPSLSKVYTSTKINLIITVILRGEPNLFISIENKKKKIKRENIFPVKLSFLAGEYPFPEDC